MKKGTEKAACPVQWNQATSHNGQLVTSRCPLIIPQGGKHMNSANEIKKALQNIHKPGTVFEIRVPTDRGVLAGYYNDFDKAAADVVRLDQQGHPGIYTAINPVNPALLNRANNKTEKLSRTTDDASIMEIRWLVVDVDPERASKTSATEAEKAAAYDVTLKVMEKATLAGARQRFVLFWATCKVA